MTQKPDTPKKSAAPQAPGGAAPTTRAEVDWERIELDYRAAIKTLRQIAEEQGITHGAINKRAKRDGWERDLTEKIKAKADALVSKAAVSTQVSKQGRIAETAVVEANAQTQASIRLAHRSDIERTRRLVMGLMSELELQSNNPELFGEIEAALQQREPGQELTAAQRAKLGDGLAKAMSLPGRSTTMRSLSESLRLLVGLERQAYGIREEMPEPPVHGMTQVTTAELLAMRDALKGGA